MGITDVKTLLSKEENGLKFGVRVTLEPKVVIHKEPKVIHKEAKVAKVTKEGTVASPLLCL